MCASIAPSTPAFVSATYEPLTSLFLPLMSRLARSVPRSSVCAYTLFSSVIEMYPPQWIMIGRLRVRPLECPGEYKAWILQLTLVFLLYVAHTLWISMSFWTTVWREDGRIPQKLGMGQSLPGSNGNGGWTIGKAVHSWPFPCLY